MYFDYEQWQFMDCDTGRDKVCLVAQDGVFTWGQMYDGACDLHTQFVAHGAGQSHPIILHGHKQSGMVMGMMACMMGNIPYVAVDSMMPAERVAKITQKSGACAVWDCVKKSVIPINNPVPIVSPMKYVKSDFQGDISYIDSAVPNSMQDIDIAPREGADKIAYILFTSGSTGEPKGVCVSQSNLASFARWILHDFTFCRDDVFLDQVIYSFDVSLTALVPTLSFGATMVSVLEQDKTQHVVKKIKENNVTVWVSTPSYAKSLLLDSDFSDSMCPSLRTFWLAGEVLPIQTVKGLYRRFTKATVTNNYGPTEATNIFTSVLVTDKWIQQGIIPIGSVMPFGRIVLLDSDETGQGEIVLVGDSVALGYLGQPDLTAEKFYNVGDTRAYKTGDLGVMRDGVLHYAGRADDQLKLHGYRIELGDIEHALQTLSGIDGAVVLPLKRNGQVVRLVGLVVGDMPADIKHQLGQVVPDYMVPSEIVAVAEFPLNLNGKVDKKGLLQAYQNGDFTA